MTRDDRKSFNDINAILKEDDRRMAEKRMPFNPITGEGSVGERTCVEIKDFALPKQWLPNSMMSVPLVKALVEAESVENFLLSIGSENSPSERDKVTDQFCRVRIKHDFAFWAATLAWIKPKGGGDDVLFKLNRPQKRLIEKFEEHRVKNEPIRLILLKARQWGGSTATQIYMAWLQLVHRTGLNSLIVAHIKDTALEVRDMFERLLSHYPIRLLYEMGDMYQKNEPKLISVGASVNIKRIPQRNCKIKIGSAEVPDSARGGDYNLVHCTEVGLWKKTEGKTPAQIVRAATKGILYSPYTSIVYESTANGTGNFFQLEYDAAKSGKSQFEAMFVPWFEIEQYVFPFHSEEERKEFAKFIFDNRLNENAATNREVSGRYLWWLFQTKGATLEAINWYVKERASCDEDAIMMAEFPSDDIEAFVHSGNRVFDMYRVEELRPSCRPPLFVGEVYADKDEGKDALTNVRFKEDKQGKFWIWAMPEIDPAEKIRDRYLVVVDIGGRGIKSDWSVILVLDRVYMMDGGKPSVVAQWYGHIDMDLLSWKASQIASFYDNALLVIESNTLETRDKERIVDGDQSSFILNQLNGVYDNLYARKQTEDEVIQRMPLHYGFHTNIATKPMIISTLVKVIREGLYTERDERCLDEYLTYEQKQNGAYGAITGKHDDLLMTRAIGLHICFFEMPVPRVVKRNRLDFEQIRNKQKIVSEASF